jgi:hypothetical protein
VRLPALHPAPCGRVNTRNCPSFLFEIDLWPSSATDLAGSTCRRYQKFERKSCDLATVVRSQEPDEFRDILPLQRKMVPDFLMVNSKLADNADARICALASTPQYRAIKHCLHPLQDPGRGFGFIKPDGLEYRKNLGWGDLRNRALADRGKHVGLHRGLPLIDVFAVRQFLTPHVKERLERISESHRFAWRESRGFHFEVAPVLGSAAHDRRLASRIVQADIGPDAEAPLKARPLIVRRSAQRFVPLSVMTSRKPAPSS